MDNQTSVLESFKQIRKRDVVKEQAEKIIMLSSVVDKVFAFKELSDIAGLKRDSQKLQKIIEGEMTQGIPLYTLGRFYLNNAKSIGRNFVYKHKGNTIKINMSIADIMLGEISGVVWNVYLKLVGGSSEGE